MAEFIENEKRNCFYVVDSRKHRVQIIDKMSKIIVRSLPFPPFLDFEMDISGVAVHGCSLFLSDVESHLIHVFDLCTGEHINTIGSEWEFGRIGHPSYMTICAAQYKDGDCSGGGDGSGDLLVVSEQFNRKYSILSLSSGDIVPDDMFHPPIMSDPAGIAVWYPSATTTVHSPLVFISDTTKHCVVVFDLFSRQLVRTIAGGGGGTTLGELCYPTGLCVHQPRGCSDDDAVLVVLDKRHGRLQVFKALSGEAVKEIKIDTVHCVDAKGGCSSSSSSGGGSCDHIAGTSRSQSSLFDVIAFTNEQGRIEIIVSDSGLHCLYVLDMDSGTHIATIGGTQGVGGEGEGEGEGVSFSYPKGIFACVTEEEVWEEPYLIK